MTAKPKHYAFRTCEIEWPNPEMPKPWTRLVGASQVLFVSHAADVQELADARIVIADGKVRVEV